MKKRTKITLLIIGLLSFTYLFAGTSFLFFPGDKCLYADSPLIKTHWQQMGGFEASTPDHLRLGCWSTALAQIVYYHKLKPFGHITYTSKKGYTIDENIDSAKIQFNKLGNNIDSLPADGKAAMARYNYYAALAIRKDFGTDSYMQKLASASLLEQHYKMKVSRYISWKGLLPYTTGKLEKLIFDELSAKRPLFLHFTDLKTFGHSVVIDACCVEKGNFKVHLNQGQGGPQDGWYELDKAILQPNDTNLRVIYTFKPL